MSARSRKQTYQSAEKVWQAFDETEQELVRQLEEVRRARGQFDRLEPVIFHHRIDRFSRGASSQMFREDMVQRPLRRPSPLLLPDRYDRRWWAYERHYLARLQHLEQDLPELQRRSGRDIDRIVSQVAELAAIEQEMQPMPLDRARRLTSGGNECVVCGAPFTGGNNRPRQGRCRRHYSYWKKFGFDMEPVEPKIPRSRLLAWNEWPSGDGNDLEDVQRKRLYPKEKRITTTKKTSDKRSHE